jgi:hypothetical protein
MVGRAPEGRPTGSATSGTAAKPSPLPGWTYRSKQVGGSGTGAVPYVVRFQSPPVKPCVRFSRTRLTDVLHRRCSALPAGPGRVWAR